MHSNWHKTLQRERKWPAPTLFDVGFINMIIPCPAAAVMYGYAFSLGSTFAATLVLGSYAIAMAIAVSGVILLIYRMTAMTN